MILRIASTKVPGGIGVVLLALLLSSCVRRYELAAPADLHTLPARYGWSGETVVAVTPWRYYGSRYRTHEFRYYYNRNDPLHYREVSVARDRTVLNFEEMPFGRVKKWVTLQTDGQTFTFSLLPMHR